jgi:hypothetical protein
LQAGNGSAGIVDLTADLSLEKIRGGDDVGPSARPISVGGERSSVYRSAFTAVC